jgi:hypothetical protein
MLKPIKKIKIILFGFDCGIRNSNNNKDLIFYSWNSDEKDNSIYRKAIKAGKVYAFYRYEFFALFMLLIGIIILLFPY